MSEAGNYQLLNNNCQDFAITLLFRVADSVEHPEQMLPLLNTAGLKLITTKVDAKTGEILVYNRKGVLLKRLHKA